jgi:hypothetical protein
MIELCREKAAREGLSPTLWVQPMHALEPPRRYRTIFVCGAFGLGSTRAQDLDALRHFYEYLLPGGKLLLDIEVPYADETQWLYWLREQRTGLPEPSRPPGERRLASDGAEYALRSRIVELEPVEQRVTLEMRAAMWRNGTLEAEEANLLSIRLYFPNELRLMLDRAGFADVAVQGDHNDMDATSDDDFVVFVATR